METAGAARWRWLAAVPSVAGFAAALRCIWDFGWTGRGTPVPVAPPQYLVVVGFYRYVRNPMYVGFGAGWIGLWIVFGRTSLALTAAAAAAALGIHLFVMLYEEPTLRNKFGADYEAYCRRHAPLVAAPPHGRPGGGRFSPTRRQDRDPSFPFPPPPPWNPDLWISSPPHEVRRLDSTLYPPRDGPHLERRKSLSHLADRRNRGHRNAGRGWHRSQRQRPKPSARKPTSR